jgi:hypothetical protein
MPKKGTKEKAGDMASQLSNGRTLLKKLKVLLCGIVVLKYEIWK